MLFLSMGYSCVSVWIVQEKALLKSEYEDVASEYECQTLETPA